ncbi:sel1 repeat family protein [bacterium]|nr:sel1 repeat family protein [bacterium]
MLPELTVASLTGWAFVALFAAGTTALFVSYIRIRLPDPRRRRLLEDADMPELKELRERAVAAVHGIGRRIDHGEAEQLLRSAYAKGDCLAGLHLSELLFSSPRHAVYKEIQAIFEACIPPVIELMDAGNPEASYLYCAASNEELTEENAVYWQSEALIAACDAGYVPALLHRGWLELDEWESAAKQIEAMQWFSLAMEQGAARALTGMGAILCNPKYPDFDPTRGLAMLEEAAVLGDRAAMYSLADCLLDPQLGDPQPEKARATGWEAVVGDQSSRKFPPRRT